MAKHFFFFVGWRLMPGFPTQVFSQLLLLYPDALGHFFLPALLQQELADVKHVVVVAVQLCSGRLAGRSTGGREPPGWRKR